MEKLIGNCLGVLIVIVAFAIIVLLLVLVPMTGAGILWIGFILGGIFILLLFVPQKRIKDIIALCIGIGLLAGSGFSYFNTQGFISNSVVTEGAVVSYESSGSGDDETYYAVIEFKAEDGDIIRFNDSYFQNPSIGDKVEVIYNPLNPSEARMYTWFALWSWSVVTFCLGVSAIVIATLRLSRLRVKRAK